MVGYASDADEDSIKLVGTITLDNVQVQTVGGRSGLLIGNLNDIALDVTDLTKIVLKNGSSYTMYKCEQNTGTSPAGKALGLQNDKALWSWCYDKNGKEDYNNDKYFYEGAYATNGTVKSTAFDSVTIEK